MNQTLVAGLQLFDAALINRSVLPEAETELSYTFINHSLTTAVTLGLQRSGFYQLKHMAICSRSQSSYQGSPKCSTASACARASSSSAQIGLAQGRMNDLRRCTKQSYQNLLLQNLRLVSFRCSLQSCLSNATMYMLYEYVLCGAHYKLHETHMTIQTDIACTGCCNCHDGACMSDAAVSQEYA